MNKLYKLRIKRQKCEMTVIGLGGLHAKGSCQRNDHRQRQACQQQVNDVANTTVHSLSYGRAELPTSANKPRTVMQKQDYSKINIQRT